MADSGGVFSRQKKEAPSGLFAMCYQSTADDSVELDDTEEQEVTPENQVYLRLLIWSAHKLPSVDDPGIGDLLAGKTSGEADSFVEVHFQGKTYKTEQIQDNNNPVFQQAFEMPIRSGRTQLSLMVKDGDLFGEATLLGESSLRVPAKPIGLKKEELVLRNVPKSKGVNNWFKSAPDSRLVVFFQVVRTLENAADMVWLAQNVEDAGGEGTQDYAVRIRVLSCHLYLDAHEKVKEQQKDCYLRIRCKEERKVSPVLDAEVQIKRNWGQEIRNDYKNYVPKTGLREIAQATTAGVKAAASTVKGISIPTGALGGDVGGTGSSQAAGGFLPSASQLGDLKAKAEKGVEGAKDAAGAVQDAAGAAGEAGKAVGDIAGTAGKAAGAFGDVAGKVGGAAGTVGDGVGAVAEAADAAEEGAGAVDDAAGALSAGTGAAVGAAERMGSAAAGFRSAASGVRSGILGEGGESPGGGGNAFRTGVTFEGRPPRAIQEVSGGDRMADSAAPPTASAKQKEKGKEESVLCPVPRKHRLLLGPPQSAKAKRVDQPQGFITELETTLTGLTQVDFMTSKLEIAFVCKGRQSRAERKKEEREVAKQEAESKKAGEATHEEGEEEEGKNSGRAAARKRDEEKIKNLHPEATVLLDLDDVWNDVNEERADEDERKGEKKTWKEEGKLVHVNDPPEVNGCVARRAVLYSSFSRFGEVDLLISVRPSKEKEEVEEGKLSEEEGIEKLQTLLEAHPYRLLCLKAAKETDGAMRKKKKDDDIRRGIPPFKWKVWDFPPASLSAGGAKGSRPIPLFLHAYADCLPELDRGMFAAGPNQRCDPFLQLTVQVPGAKKPPPRTKTIKNRQRDVNFDALYFELPPGRRRYPVVVELMDDDSVFPFYKQSELLGKVGFFNVKRLMDKPTWVHFFGGNVLGKRKDVNDAMVRGATRPPSYYHGSLCLLFSQSRHAGKAGTWPPLPSVVGKRRVLEVRLFRGLYLFGWEKKRVNVLCQVGGCDLLPMDRKGKARGPCPDFTSGSGVDMRDFGLRNLDLLSFPGYVNEKGVLRFYSWDTGREEKEHSAPEKDEQMECNAWVQRRSKEIRVLEGIKWCYLYVQEVGKEEQPPKLFARLELQDATVVPKRHPRAGAAAAGEEDSDDDEDQKGGDGNDDEEKKPSEEDDQKNEPERKPERADWKIDDLLEKNQAGWVPLYWDTSVCEPTQSFRLESSLAGCICGWAALRHVSGVDPEAEEEEGKAGLQAANPAGKGKSRDKAQTTISLDLDAQKKTSMPSMSQLLAASQRSKTGEKGPQRMVTVDDCLYVPAPLAAGGSAAGGAGLRRLGSPGTVVQCEREAERADKRRNRFSQDLFLYADILQARNLPAEDADGLCDPVWEICVEDQRVGPPEINDNGDLKPDVPRSLNPTYLQRSIVKVPFYDPPARGESARSARKLRNFSDLLAPPPPVLVRISDWDPATFLGLDVFSNAKPQYEPIGQFLCLPDRAGNLDIASMSGFPQSVDEDDINELLCPAWFSLLGEKVYTLPEADKEAASGRWQRLPRVLFACGYSKTGPPGLKREGGEGVGNVAPLLRTKSASRKGWGLRPLQMERFRFTVDLLGLRGLHTLSSIGSYKLTVHGPWNGESAETSPDAQPEETEEKAAEKGKKGKGRTPLRLTIPTYALPGAANLGEDESIGTSALDATGMGVRIITSVFESPRLPYLRIENKRQLTESIAASSASIRGEKDASPIRGSSDKLGVLGKSGGGQAEEDSDDEDGLGGPVRVILPDLVFQMVNVSFLGVASGAEGSLSVALSDFRSAIGGAGASGMVLKLHEAQTDLFGLHAHVLMLTTAWSRNMKEKPRGSFGKSLMDLVLDEYLNPDNSPAALQPARRELLVEEAQQCREDLTKLRAKRDAEKNKKKRALLDEGVAVAERRIRNAERKVAKLAQSVSGDDADVLEVDVPGQKLKPCPCGVPETGQIDISVFVYAEMEGYMTFDDDTIIGRCLFDLRVASIVPFDADPRDSSARHVQFFNYDDSVLGRGFEDPPPFVPPLLVVEHDWYGGPAPGELSGKKPPTAAPPTTREPIPARRPIPDGNINPAVNRTGNGVQAFLDEEDPLNISLEDGIEEWAENEERRKKKPVQVNRGEVWPVVDNLPQGPPGRDRGKASGATAAATAAAGGQGIAAATAAAASSAGPSTLPPPPSVALPSTSPVPATGAAPIRTGNSPTRHQKKAGMNARAQLRDDPEGGAFEYGGMDPNMYSQAEREKLFKMGNRERFDFHERFGTFIRPTGFNISSDRQGSEIVARLRMYSKRRASPEDEDRPNPFEATENIKMSTFSPVSGESSLDAYAPTYNYVEIKLKNVSRARVVWRSPTNRFFQTGSLLMIVHIQDQDQYLRIGMPNLDVRFRSESTFWIVQTKTQHFEDLRMRTGIRQRQEEVVSLKSQLRKANNQKKKELRNQMDKLKKEVEEKKKEMDKNKRNRYLGRQTLFMDEEDLLAFGYREPIQVRKGEFLIECRKTAGAVYCRPHLPGVLRVAPRANNLARALTLGERGDKAAELRGNVVVEHLDLDDGKDSDEEEEEDEADLRLSRTYTEGGREAKSKAKKEFASFVQEATKLPLPKAPRQLHWQKTEVTVHLYVLTCRGLANVDGFGKSDPLLQIAVGRGESPSQVLKGKKEFDNDNNPEFYEHFQFNLSLPGDGVVKVQVMDKDDFSSNDLIGEVELDLEERWLGMRNGLAAGRSVITEFLSLEDFLLKLNPGPGEDRWKTFLPPVFASPIEFAPLSKGSGAGQEGVQTGAIRLFVDMAEASAPYSVLDVEEMARNEEWELRLIVYDVKDIMYFLDVGERNDLKVQASVQQLDLLDEHTEVKKITDVHKWAHDFAAFNWRMTFDVKVPNSALAIKFTLLDDDSLGGDDMVYMPEYLNLDDLWRLAREMAAGGGQPLGRVESVVYFDKPVEKEYKMGGLSKFMNLVFERMCGKCWRSCKRKCCPCHCYERCCPCVCKAPKDPIDEETRMYSDGLPEGYCCCCLCTKGCRDNEGCKKSAGSCGVCCGRSCPCCCWPCCWHMRRPVTYVSAKLRVSLELMPKKVAANTKVGEGREDPNDHPYLAAPDGRVGWGLLFKDPMQFMKVMLGPTNFRRLQVCCGVSCCLVLVAGLLFVVALVFYLLIQGQTVLGYKLPGADIATG